MAALRLRAKLRQTKLAMLAGVNRDTIGRIESGGGVTAFTAQKVLDALNKELGTSYTLDQIEGLNVTRM